MLGSPEPQFPHEHTRSFLKGMAGLPAPQTGCGHTNPTFTRRPHGLDTMGMPLVIHAKPVHELPSCLPPVQSRMDIHGDPAGQPEPVVTAGESPVPAVQSPRGNGGEECHINPGTKYPSGVPPGIPWASWIRIPEKIFPLSPALHRPARSGRRAGAATLSGWGKSAGSESILFLPGGTTGAGPTPCRSCAPYQSLSLQAHIGKVC
jgi:hypothetical protein